MASISKSSAAFKSITDVLRAQQTDGGITATNLGADRTANRRKNSPHTTQPDLDKPWSCANSGDSSKLETSKTEGQDSLLTVKLKQLFIAFEDDPCSASQIAKKVDELMRSSKEYVKCELWEVLVDDILMRLVVEQGSPYTQILTISTSLMIDNPMMQKVLMKSLVHHSEILLDGLNFQVALVSNLCGLMGALATLKWDMNYASCAKETNAVLYTVLNIVHSWVRLIEKNCQRRSMGRNSTNVQCCAIALAEFCNICGRKLWLCWPELVDKIYVTIKSAIASHEIPINVETKYILIDLYVVLNQWPKREKRSVDKRTTATQTGTGLNVFASHMKKNLPES